MEIVSPVVSAFRKWAAQEMGPIARDLAILDLSFGLDGNGCRSLVDVGKQLSQPVSREAVRLSLARVLRFLLAETARPLPDIVRHCFAHIESLAPIETADLANELCKQGLLSTGFNGEGLVKLAVTFGDLHGLEIIRSSGGSFLAHPMLTEAIKPVLSAAIKLVSQSGMATLDDVAREAIADIHRRGKASIDLSHVTRDAVRAILSCSADVIWIDREEGFFFFGDDRRNRLVTRLRKVFSIARSVEIDALVHAVNRSMIRSNRQVVKPCISEITAPMLRKFISATSMFKIVGDQVICNCELTIDDELCPLEMIIFEFMAKSPDGVREKRAIDHYVETHPKAIAHYTHAVGGKNAGTRGLRPMATQVIGFTPILRRQRVGDLEVRGMYELVAAPKRGRKSLRNAS